MLAKLPNAWTGSSIVVIQTSPPSNQIMVNVSGIDFESIVDGTGVRVVVFFSGCKHNCLGCHNPTSHDFFAGRPFTQELEDELIKYMEMTPFISGITFSGGDPMYSSNDISKFAARIKAELPTKSIWVYSGFTYEEIAQDEAMLHLLSFCDVLVDGPFVLSERDITLPFRGSRNQRIIDIPATIVSGHVVELDVV